MAASPDAATARAAPAEEFVISRVFDAPRDLVWKAWTESERLLRWWGPKGCTLVSCTLDLRPGGIFHYHMRFPDGLDTWGKFVFREIVAPERLIFVVSFSDEKGGVTRNPWNSSWPLEWLSTVTFEEQGGGTKLTVRWAPDVSATELERKTFADGRQGMQQGWTGTLDRLSAYLAQA
jgi:uncharacterized protein YndB with AHSA1/START domain